MLASALLGIFLIPMLYVVFQWLREKTGWKPDHPPSLAPASASQETSSVSECSGRRSDRRPRRVERNLAGITWWTIRGGQNAQGWGGPDGSWAGEGGGRSGRYRGGPDTL